MSNYSFFCIIGAPKCGTTALWKMLETHPEISMPISKESPYFLSRRLKVDSFGDHIAKYYRQKENAHLFGSSTPQYLVYPVAAERIANVFPQAKLIVVLRDPIERSISHFCMVRRKGYEKRDINLVFNKLISSGNDDFLEIDNVDDLNVEIEANYYLSHSRYAIMISEYERYFDRSNILYLSQKDLLENTNQIYLLVLNFLGVSASIESKAVGRRYNVGGDSLIHSLIAKLRSITPLWLFMKRIIPNKLWLILAMKISTVNGSEEKRILIDDALRQRLKIYFSEEYSRFSRYF